MTTLDGYLARMTPEKLWPAAHSAEGARKAIEGVADPVEQVLRWSSNGRCPMDDMLAAWLTLGIITRGQADATSAARREETERFLAAYRIEDPGPDTEQLSEMRAAFGPGATVVNALSGRVTKL